jgi:3-oxoacyl-[acyl-carrier-protein] synthase I
MSSATIRGAGAITSLGTLVPAAAAARARLLEARSLDLGAIPGGAGVEGAAGHAIQGLDPDLTGLPRVEAILARAAADLAAATGAPAAGRAGVFLGVGGIDADTSAGDRLAGLVAARLAIEPREHGCFPGGRAGTIRALEAAFHALAMGSVDQAVVGGCESKLDPAALARALADGRLKTADFPVGFIPGEAAALCVLDARAVAARPTVTAPVTAREESCRSAGHPAIGKRLAEVIVEALAGAPANAAGSVFLDLNGEAYRATDWAMAQVRARRTAALDRLHPELVVLGFGDVGAAFPILAMALAGRAFERGYGRGPLALVCTSADGGERAAFTVHGPG